MNEWFEIFRTGTHTDTNGNTRTWTEEDLDSIINNYQPDQYEAPIVIGHPATDAPAFGWIEKLERVGDKLLAKAKQLVPEFVDLVRDGLYKKVSIAVTSNNELRHVGFLGAAAPAISGLIPAQFCNAEEVLSYESSVPVEESSAIENQTGNSEDVLREQIAELEQKFAESDADKQRLREIINTQNQSNTLQEFQAFLVSKVKLGVLTPAQKELAARVAFCLQQIPTEAQQANTDLEFSSGIKSSPAFIAFTQFIDALPNQFEFGEVATKKTQQENTSHSDVDYASKLISVHMKTKN